MIRIRDLTLNFKPRTWNFKHKTSDIERLIPNTLVISMIKQIIIGA